MLTETAVVVSEDPAVELFVAQSPGPADRALLRAERQSAEAALWDAGTLSGVDLVREAAFAGAPANVWREDRLAVYLRVLAQVRFSAEWLGPWQSCLWLEAIDTFLAAR